MRADDQGWLERYAVLERGAEGGDGEEYRPYAQVLRAVMTGLGEEYSLELSGIERDALVESLPRWPAFADTARSLERFRAAGLKLGVISNVDGALFEATCRSAGFRPDWVVTAEQCRSYKPSLNNFRVAMAEHELEAASWVHVAQSQYHDIEPTGRLGVRSVWVDRRAGREGHGATVPSSASPTVRVTSLAELAGLIEKQRGS